MKKMGSAVFLHFSFFSLGELVKCGSVVSCIALALALPPFSYLMIPHYHFRYRGDEISRVEFDHEYFGAF